MNKLHDAHVCVWGLVLVAITVALGYGAVAQLFEHAALASGLR